MSVSSLGFNTTETCVTGKGGVLGLKTLQGIPGEKHVWIGFKPTRWKSLLYVIPEMNITKLDGLKVFQMIQKEFLPCIGIWRTFTMEMIYAPQTFMGLGILDFKL